MRVKGCTISAVVAILMVNWYCLNQSGFGAFAQKVAILDFLYWCAEGVFSDSILHGIKDHRKGNFCI